MKEVFEGCGSMEGIEEIGHIESLMLGMVHNSGGEVVETEHVRHFTSQRGLHVHTPYLHM